MNKDYNEDYMNYLELLRQSGVTNMYGASPYLQEEFGLSREEASKVLVFWMEHYEALSKELGWKE